jgi:cobalt-zinc-cadmium efflux system outer membrane protein
MMTIDPMLHRPGLSSFGTPVPPARPSCPVWLFALAVLAMMGSWPVDTFAQSSFTWQEIRAKFEAANPTLQADQIGIDESKANEITAFLRPNPQFGVTADQIGHNAENRPFADTITVFAVAYLHERQHKRELRRESAQKATAMAVSGHADLDRTLVFTLRGAFVQVLQAKAALVLARDNLRFYDQVLMISQDRRRAGDIAQIDYDRLELQRVQLEAAEQTADVNLRTAKIQMLTLLNDRTPIDQFDVTGPFDFAEVTPALVDLRQRALDTRPDLRVALQALDKADTDHRLATANGSTDPIFTVDAGLPTLSDIYQSYPAPLYEYVGLNVSIPLRIFDRNQGEKLRTQLDITRNQRLTDVARAQVFNDVDSAYATLVSNVILLKPYKDHYLAQALRVRDTVTYAYQRGGAALLDFLQAEQDYRSVQFNYVSLVGSYLTAAAQLNLAVGQEVIP